MDLEQIMLREIRLVSLFIKAKAVKKFPYAVKNRYWYKILKPKMLKLVGFESENEALRSTEIYDMIYSHCLSLMRL